jgi:hypothetical protein
MTFTCINHQSELKAHFHEATNEAAISSVSISPDGRGEGRVALKIAKYVCLRWPQQMSMLLGPAIRDSYKSNMPLWTMFNTLFGI